MQILDRKTKNRIMQALYKPGKNSDVPTKIYKAFEEVDKTVDKAIFGKKKKKGEGKDDKKDKKDKEDKK